MKKKKKILLLSDDIRMHSGISSQARELILNTIHEYDFAQIAGSINHPEKGKILDLSREVARQTGVEDAYVKLYPTDGYGNMDIVRELIAREKPDLILMFTDPRFWTWLFSSEHELRGEIPIAYLNIWDNLGFSSNEEIVDPNWNKPYYNSCDLLMAISKQTYGINKRLCSDFEDWRIKYIPHGIDTKKYFPIREGDENYQSLVTYRKQIFGNKDPEFVIMLSNRNIRRKNISDIIAAYKLFCQSLPKEKADKCMLYLHTHAIDQNGTDLFAVIEAICPEYNISISNGHCDTKELNFLYNIADVTINVASNEGFGLTTCEGLASGTPTIVNVTGGLQDQCGFKLDNKFITANDYINIGSLHREEMWMNNPNLTHGDWVYPIWSKSLSIKGSTQTPYILDDTVNYPDIVNGFQYFYNMTKDERNERGIKGREFLLSKDAKMNHNDLGKNYVNAINGLFENWKPSKRFGLYETNLNMPTPKLRLVDPKLKVLPPKQKVLKLPKLAKIKN